MRERVFPCAVLLAASVFAACGARRAEPAQPTGSGASAASDPALTVRGVVLDGRGGFPLKEQMVAIGKLRATTDADGHFEVRGVPRVYDLVLLDPTRAHAKIYVGLTRRDPLLVHADQRTAERDVEHAAHRAAVVGVLSGGGEYPLTDAMHVHFRARLGDGDVMLGGLGTPHATGPEFGPLSVAWDGPSTISGQLIALRRTLKPEAHGYCALAPLTLQDKHTQSVQLAFEEVPLLRRPPVNVTFPEAAFSSPELHDEYRFPDSSTVLHGNAVSARQAYDVADLTRCHATLCTAAWIYNPYLHSSALACGPTSERAVVISLRDAPKFSAPAFRTPAALGLRFVWTTLPGAIYQLTLKPYEPTTAAPEIQVLTRDASASWPDLGALDVAFPKPLNAYGATVTAIGPWASVDDAASSTGLGWGTPGEAWSSESQELSIPVEPPLGKEEAACQYPYGTVIVCSEPLDPVEGTREHYMLGAINTKLRRHPEFAAAIGIHCVRDCAGGRKFMAAYAKYAHEHPAFDANDPLEPTEPPPPPPPELQQHMRQLR